MATQTRTNRIYHYIGEYISSVLGEVCVTFHILIREKSATISDNLILWASASLGAQIAHGICGQSAKNIFHKDSSPYPKFWLSPFTSRKEWSMRATQDSYDAARWHLYMQAIPYVGYDTHMGSGHASRWGWPYVHLFRTSYLADRRSLERV